MEVAYVAGPYRGKNINEVVENIRKAETIAKELWKKGYVALCPHKNSALLDGIVDDQVFLEGGLELLKRCDLLVLDNNSKWEDSGGTIDEIYFAIKHNIPVWFISIENGYLYHIDNENLLLLISNFCKLKI